MGLINSAFNSSEALSAFHLDYRVIYYFYPHLKIVLCLQQKKNTKE